MKNRNPKFNSAYLKLTLFYVLILMFISIAFSVVIYNISSAEIGRGLGWQVRMVRDNAMLSIQSQQIQSLEQSRLAQIDESNDRLKLNLLYFNLLILLVSSGVSYFLARRTLEPIKESMDAQSRFTADASHELRTPLTAMRTEIEVTLREKKLDLTQAKNLLLSNLEEIGKLESLSNALLKLARLDDAKLNMQEISLQDTLIEAYEKTESLARAKSIKVEPHLTDIMIAGDKQSLIELFIILLDNAVKYSPKKSKISVSLSQSGSNAVVTVKDQGIGINASDLPFIFNRFYRADVSRSKEKVTGYGLGLSIAKQIINLHQGDISVESTPGIGSKFIVKLPILIKKIGFSSK